MKYLINFVLVIGLFFSVFFTGIFAADEPNFVCCYTGADLKPTLQGLCSGLELSISVEACGVLQDRKLGCMKNNVCYASVEGNTIYDTPLIKEMYFGTKCTDFSTVEGFSRCTGATSGVVTDPTINGSGTGDGGELTDGYEGGDGTSLDPNTIANQISCTVGGGAMGLYVSKDRCEGVSLSGSNNFCIYNYVQGGKFKTNFKDYNDLGMSLVESQSCLVNKAIKKCSDYKNQDVCSSNRAELAGESCVWVPSETYAMNSAMEGMCVSDVISSTKYFNKKRYDFRGNVVKQSSFESGASSWDISEGIVIDSKYAPSGVKSMKLQNGAVLSQELIHLGTDKNYYLSFMLKPLSLDGTLIIKLDGEIFGQYEVEKLFDNESLHEFKQISATSFIPQASSVLLTFELAGGSSLGVELDGVSVATSSSSYSPTTNLKIYNPIEIIPYSASYCMEECFQNMTFNLCTQKKSDLLGDCSYMVSGPNVPYGNDIAGNSYLGIEENLLLKEGSWQAQSIQNALLFCEMYTSSSQCLDSGNYVNSKFKSFHTTSGSTLCKWQDGAGCFKDSDNSGGPDTHHGEIKDITDATLHGKFSSVPGSYSKSSDEGNYSDFALACDVMPPNSYVVISGRNASGDKVYLGVNDNNQLIGDVEVTVTATDLLLDSCSAFTDVGFNKLEIDYIMSDGKVLKVEEPSNQYFGRTVKMGELLVDELGESIVTDDATGLKILVRDQSGNVGKVWDFPINVDILPPEINLLRPSFDIGNINSNIYISDTTFSFDITDESAIDSCSYFLIPGDGVDSSFYNASGIFDFPPSGQVQFDFPLPIYDSSPNGDFYTLAVTCEDIYQQSNTVFYPFTVDYNTDMVLVTPRSYVGYEYDLGYLNSETDLVLWSSEVLTVCKVEYDALSSPANLNVVDFDESLHSQYFAEDFDFSLVKKVVTGKLDLNADGFHVGKIICDDSSGNAGFEDHSYYYDTVSPDLNSFKIEDDSYNMIVGDDGKNYLRKLITGSNSHLVRLNFTIDGTGTWITDNDLKLFHPFGAGEQIELIDFTSSTEINELDNVGTLNMDLFVVSDLVSGIDVPGEIGLKEYKYILNYFDKANNSASSEFSYYFDASKPDLVFTGDVVENDLDDEYIFTKNANPHLSVSFNAPSYRTFSCTASMTKQNSGSNYLEFNNVTSMDFDLAEIDIHNWFGVDNPAYLNFKCVDIYGVNFEKDLILIYDDVPLILESVGFVNGDFKFSKLRTNFEMISDRLELTFADTGEVGGYLCTYELEELSEMYDCLPESSLSKFKDGLNFESGILDLFSGRENGFDIDSEVTCVRKGNFNSLETLAWTSGSNLESKMRVNVNCVDGVGFSSSKSFDFSYNYVFGSLVDFTFNYDGGVAYPVVKSLIPYETVEISFMSDGSSPIITLNSFTEVGGVYLYEATLSGINLADFDDGENLVYAVAFDVGGIYQEKIAENLIIDGVVPLSELSVPDLNLGSVVYTSDFEILYSGEDLDSGISLVEIIVNSETVMSYNYGSDLDVFSEHFEALPANNYFYDSNNRFSGRAVYTGAVMNESYNIVLKVYDKVGNVVEKSIDVMYVDGVAIKLMDSTNALVDSSKFRWITKANAPIIAFNTSKYVVCNVYPYVDDVDTVLTQTSNTEFSFDLDRIPGFVLDDFPNNLAPITISCTKQDTGDVYNYTRNLVLANNLPDYVLIPEDGFKINEGDFKSTVVVRSLGPFREISCEYSLNGRPSVNFAQEDVVELTEGIDFSVFSGIVNMELKCSDALGTFGPTKIYEFNVAKFDGLRIDEDSVRLIYGSEETKLVNGEMTSFGVSGVDLSFSMNKKDLVKCTYQVNPTGSTFDGFINFFRNLFGVEKYDVVSNNPYEFRGSGLMFEEGSNSLEIACEAGSDSFEKTYVVNYIDRDLTLDVSRVSQ